MLEAKNITF